VASAAVSLVAGGWGGLARLGWSVPATAPLVASHGPLMAVGFFGTVIGLERAIAHGRPWAFSAPVASASAAIGSCAGMPASIAAILTFASGVAMLVMFLSAIRRERSLHLAVSAMGAASFAVGGAVWLARAPLFHVVPWWVAFVLLTVIGERLELTRLLPPSRRARIAFVSVLVLYVLALGASLVAPDVGARARGAAMVAFSAWLESRDVARRTVRVAGAPRYVASCLLAGYAWLAVAGALGAAYGDVAVGPLYDAGIHALFLGFGFSMIFGHAPMVLPAVAGVRVTFTRALYAPVAILHAALVARVAGDLTGFAAARSLGGLFNAAAILLFVALMVRAARSKEAIAPPTSVGTLAEDGAPPS
jgi:hypothetical protein